MNNRIWTSLRSVKHKELYLSTAKKHKTGRLSAYIRAWLTGPILLLIKNDITPEQIEVKIEKIIKICKED